MRVWRPNVVVVIDYIHGNAEKAAEVVDEIDYIRGNAAKAADVVVVINYIPSSRPFARSSAAAARAAITSLRSRSAWR